MPFGGLLTASLIGGGSSLLSGFLGGGAAKKAAQVQADATRYAADKEGQTQGDILKFNDAVWQKQQQDLAPWLHTGTGAVLALDDMLQNPESDLRRGFDPQSFGSNFTGDPGYQFRLNEGAKAIERSAAAKGTSLGGGALKALTRFGQDYGSNEYDRAYHRAETTTNTNNSNVFNRLASLAGLGLTSGQTLGAEGTAQAGLNANAQLTTSGRQSDLITQGANARASGYVGGANAWQGALGGISNAAQSFSLLKMLRNGGAFGSGVPAGWTPGGGLTDNGSWMPKGGPMSWVTP